MLFVYTSFSSVIGLRILGLRDGARGCRVGCDCVAMADGLRGLEVRYKGFLTQSCLRPKGGQDRLWITGIANQILIK